MDGCFLYLYTYVHTYIVRRQQQSWKLTDFLGTLHFHKTRFQVPDSITGTRYMFCACLVIRPISISNPVVKAIATLKSGFPLMNSIYYRR